MKKQNKPLIILTILACVVAAALIMGLTRKKESAHSLTVINTAGQPTLGQANARVSVVVFEDLKCPVCAEFNKVIFPKVIKPAIDEGKIKGAKFQYGDTTFFPHVTGQPLADPEGFCQSICCQAVAGSAGKYSNG